ncbi:MAG: hypothetical protein QMD65_03185 [Patescibacteria group bacterium]|nr:hypothetical protein [Patescibacteria group bacterium]
MTITMTPKRIVLKSLFLGLLVFLGSALFSIANAQEIPNIPTNVFQDSYRDLKNNTSSCAIKISWKHATSSDNLVIPERFDIYRTFPTGFSPVRDFVSSTYPGGGTGSFSYVIVHRKTPSVSWTIIPNTAVTNYQYAHAIRACSISNDDNSCSVTSIPAYLRTPIISTSSRPEIISVEATTTGGHAIEIKWRVPATSTNFADYGYFILNAASSTMSGLTFNPIPPLDRIVSSTILGSNTGDSGRWLFNVTPSSGLIKHPRAYGFHIKNRDTGGYGCAYTESPTSHYITSASSLPSPSFPGIVVPAAPEFASQQTDFNSHAITLIWHDIATGTTTGIGAANDQGYEVWRAAQTTANEPPASLYKYYASTAENGTSTVDSDCKAGHFCWYKVRACRNNTQTTSMPLKVCSFFSVATSSSAYVDPPKDFDARLIHISTSTKKGLVYFEWDADVPNVESFVIEQSKDGGIFGKATSTSEAQIFLDIDLDHNYRFQIRSVFIGGTSTPSDAVPVNTNIRRVLKGKAWQAADLGGDENRIGLGVGWISFNSDSVDRWGNKHVPDDPTNPDLKYLKYSVQVDDSGLVSGLARAGGIRFGYGWLSFHKKDLTGCPVVPCEARYNSSTQKFSGWARFLGPKMYASLSSPNWQGWVKLSGTINEVLPPPPPPPLSPTPPLSPPPPSSFDLKNFVNHFTASIVPREVLGLLKRMAVKAFAQYPPPPSAGTGYGLSLNPVTSMVSGEIWGGDQIGWIAFSKTGEGNDSCTSRDIEGLTDCAVLADSISEVPRVTEVAVKAGPPVELWCDMNPYYRVSWNYNPGSSGSPQESYLVEFKDASIHTVVTSTTANDTATSFLLYKPLEALISDGGSLPRNFYAAVRIKNTLGVWSSSTNSLSTTTPTHYPPLVNFSYASTTTNGVFNFADKSLDRSSGLYPKPWVWGWYFEKGVPMTANTENVTGVDFGTAISSIVNHSVDDNSPSGMICEIMADIDLKNPKPPILIRRIFRER